MDKLINQESNIDEEKMELRRGPWSVEEDFVLMNYISHHGEGRWNSLSRCAGLKRTGKSCRLRWLNYLRPDVRHGNITLEEQLLILQLHSRWGNRWSKIAQHLPGRTDNEIKNYWRTRVQKHAKQLKCDVNSKQFQDTLRYLWIPRLVERIQASKISNNNSSSETQQPVLRTGITELVPIQLTNNNNNSILITSVTPENSSVATSSENSNQDYYQVNQSDQLWYEDYQAMDQQNNIELWMDNEDVFNNLWSKIAEHLPGRTDNEIKNYWRTRVQKHAKQLKCDVNSKQFQDTLRYLWIPRLVERIQASKISNNNSSNETQQPVLRTGITELVPIQLSNNNNNFSTSVAPENYSVEASSENSIGTQFSPNQDYYQVNQSDQLWFEDYQAMDHQNNIELWMDNEDAT
ncbi:hypothetical protein H5410_063727 [Solanum commersonii]|uniref:MYB transcription factor n=1 Tax=Solanum commersonii TaxID=4109 RepID=A0A9J5WE12_SOLCO|nr:hypothetical protein H5410_063727 [Solanum commersonii]